MERNPWTRAVSVSAWVLVLFAVLVHVPYPLSGDQALFVYGSGRLLAGDRLYVEFWDNKQPGIYWFYLAARGLLGPTAAGVHGLEALWMIGVALLSYGIARRAGVSGTTSCLAPIASVVAFYSAAGAWHLTQIESLVGLPLLAVAAAAVLPSDTGAERLRNAALIGVGTGIVATFKLVLTVVPAGMCLLYAAWVVRTRRATAGRATTELLVPAVMAGALVVGGAALFLASRGGGPEAFWANFEYPLAAAREIPAAPVGRLIASAKWLLAALWPFLPLALAGAALAAEPAAASARRNQVRLLMIGWIMLGACAVLVQVFSWWEYHFALFFVPIGLLATIGLAELGARQHSSAAARAAFGAAVLVAALGVVSAAYRLGSKGLALKATSDLAPALPGDPITAEMGALDASVRDALGTAAPGRRLYVFGDPRLLLASGGSQAIPTHGWAWELMLESQWRELPGALAAAAPEAVYVSSFYQELLCRRSPALVAWLRESYDEQAPDALGGVWLLRSPASTVGVAGSGWTCGTGRALAASRN